MAYPDSTISPSGFLAKVRVFIEHWWTHGVAAAASITAVVQTNFSHLYAGLIVAGSLAVATFLKYLKAKVKL